MYYMKVTTIGAAKLAAALAAGTPLEITQMAVGDGNGADVAPPVGTEEALVREVFRAPLSSLSESVSDPTIVLAEFPIPSATGGFYIREVGVFDDAGDLIAYGNFPVTYKPVPTDGTTRDMVVQSALKVGNAAAVTLVIDPNVVGATRAWVSALFAPIDSPDFIGTPKVPTPPANDVSQLVPNTRWVTQLVEATAGNYVLDTGVANAYVVALNPALTGGYNNGLTVAFRPQNTNTAGCTLNAGAGVVPMLRDDGTPLQAGDVPIHAIVSCVYDSTAAAFLVKSIVLSQLGTMAKLGIGDGMANDGAGNLAVSGPTYVNAARTLLGGEYLVDTSAGGFTLTLPAAPLQGRTITLIDAMGTWGKTTFTLARNGKTIMGLAADLTVNVADQKFSIWFNGSDWRLV
jgi:hypothetical protein